MSTLRNKALAKAQKLLQKGKTKEAIEAFLEVVKEDPSDVRTLLKVAELQAKISDIASASQTFEKVAKHYSKDGFYLKAVAVYKQILKIDPGFIKIYLSLGELYQNLNLNSEAMKQYQTVVKHYESQGLVKESLDVLKKMTELEPDNFLSKTKLAELYHKEGHPQESLSLFTNLVGDLRTKQNFVELSRVLEKMSKLGLGGDELKLEMIEACIDSGDPSKALTQLQNMFAQNDKNPKVLELLGKTFTELKQFQKARAVYGEILSLLNANPDERMKDRIIAKQRALDLLTGPPLQETTDDLGLLDTAPSAPAVSNVPGPAAPTEVAYKNQSLPAASATQPAQPTAAPDEVGLLLQYGLVDKALSMMGQQLSDDPTRGELIKRMIDVAMAHGQIDKVRQSFVQALESAKTKNSGVAISNIETALHHLESSVQTAQPSPSVAQVQTKGPFDFDVEEVSLEVVEDSISFSGVSTEQVQIENKLFNEVSDSEFDTAFAMEDEPKAPLDSNSIEVENAKALEREVEIDLQEVSLGIDVSSPTAFEEVEASESSPSVFEINQQHQDLSAFENFPQTQAASSLFVNSDIDQAFDVSLEPQVEQPLETSLASESFSADAEERSQPQDISVPSKVELSETPDYFDLSVELKDEIQALEQELSKPKSEEEILSPEEVISEFKKGVSRTVARNDHQTQYNLGIAYKEMGLLDEAIAQFKMAGESKDLALDSASMIGLCLLNKREFKAAIRVYKQTLQYTKPDHPGFIGVCYELAESYVGNGEIKDAFILFSKIMAKDPSFRDVKRRTKELAIDLGIEPKPSSATNQSEGAPDEKIKPNKNKISFI